MKPIADRTGRTVGYEDQAGDRTKIHDRTGKVLGWYDEREDRTFTREGSFFGKGDQTQRVLGESKDS